MVDQQHIHNKTKIHYLYIKTLTIITTGIANWNNDTYDNNIIEFLIIILESLIINTFFGKITNFNIINYDSHLSIDQQGIINSLIDILKTNYFGVNFQITNINKNLFPDTIIPGLENINPYLTIHLDFANLDGVENLQKYRDTYLNINDVGIKKIYFGYWEPNYPDTYKDIIKGIKLMDIEEKSRNYIITTYIDKFKILGLTHPRYLKLFHKLPECPDTPRSVITIPGFRTQYQQCGIKPEILYAYLWQFQNDDLQLQFIKIKEDIYEKLFSWYLNILFNEESNRYCIFCQYVKCPTIKENSIPEANKNLCRLCYNLKTSNGTIDMVKFNNYININTPPCEN